MRATIRELRVASLSLGIWLVAAFTTGATASFFLSRHLEPDRSSVASMAATAGVSEFDALRKSLAGANAENQTLRQELDRLAGRVREIGMPRAPEIIARYRAASEKMPISYQPGRLRDLAGRLEESLSRAVAGDAGSEVEAAAAMLEIGKAGPHAFETLRNSYLAAADPRARLMILPKLLASGGTEARDLVIDQLQSEADPELRRALLRQAAGFASPEVAPLLRETFLQALTQDGDLTTRVAAVRGLRYAQGPEIEEAMLSAATDPSEKLRLAAIEQMVGRPGMQGALRDLLTRESSGRIRQIGECRLLISQGVRPAS